MPDPTLPEPPGPGPRWLPRLLRQAAFRRYWSAQTVSLFGDEVSTLAIPLLAVLATGAGPAQMGYLTAAGLAPNLLFSVLAGAWVDRYPHKRRVMIAADLGRALLLAAVPVLWFAEMLTLPQLYVVMFAVGTLSMVFQVAYSSLFVALVARDDYLDANALINGSRAMSSVAGPSIGGVLVQVFSAPIAVIVDAASYLFSALLLARTKAVEIAPSTRKGALSNAVSGLRYLARSVTLRSILLASTTLNLFNYMFEALFILYATTELNVSAGLLGIVIGAGATGGLIGAVVTGRITRRFGIGPTLVAAYVIFPAPLILVPFADGPLILVLAMLFVAEFVSGMGVVMLDINAGAVQTAATPPPMLARIQGARRTVNYGIRPIGALLGGALGATIGLEPTVWIAVCGGLLGVLWIIFSPLPRLRALPEPDLEEPPGQGTAAVR
ncbi:MFS transporter [Actinoplanes sp. NPDC049596]|uniref:MFS transporter n=1 Tax=unclassified Actinoplanes TaxID=2626549 RepID=UPI00341461F1